MTAEKLISKYNVPAPRYTSYPTVPLWENQPLSASDWLHTVTRTFEETNQSKGISLYLHLPFCESLCTYCGCNKRITKNHNVEQGYIKTLLAEWNTYNATFNAAPRIRELHLGGGTPTFFKPENLKWLLSEMLDGCDIFPGHDFSFEGHPNNTTTEHLRVLAELGFNRVSYGIQDLDLKVQQAINRFQPFKNVQTVTEAARELGYKSINFDLIYGLPFQTLESMEFTIEKVAQLMPERIAFYSYAHVPWKSKSQRGYSEENLPSDAYKRALYELGRDKFCQLGYRDIGMDHFALPHDDLYKAASAKTLHRNFMGYTVCNTELLIGLGCSAISDAKYAYLQNQKVVETYKEEVAKSGLALQNNHRLSLEDLKVRKEIINLFTTSSADYSALELPAESIFQLEIMQSEGLLILENAKLTLTETGLPFIRNVAMQLDKRLQQTAPATQPVFSKSI